MAVAISPLTTMPIRNNAGSRKRSELRLVDTDLHFASARVDEQIAVLERRAFRLFAFGRGAAEDGLDPGDELARVERLRHVVVRADLEPDDLVDVFVTRGQHQDRDV